MKKLLFITALVTLYGCKDSSPLSEGETAPLFIGSTYQVMTTEESGTTPTSTLPEGTEALFNAAGGLTLTNQTMTYTNGQWRTSPQPEWGVSTETTKLTALHPFLKNDIYTAGNLYDENGMLADILYAQGSFTAREDISLQFKHLFSKVTFQLKSHLQQKFKSITLTYPKTITSINPLTADIEPSGTTPTHHRTATITTPTPDGRYSFIVPAAEGVTISLSVSTTTKEYLPKEITACTFVRGYETVYRVDSDEKTNGISTTKQFILFSQLINKSSLTADEQKTLDSFGETTDDGVTTYYLLNDLDFTGVDCSALEQIGYYTVAGNKYFENTFDGQGYTISKLTPKTNNGTTGLFGAIGENGILKNLQMKSCEAHVTNTSNSGVSILIGLNRGTISNCSVDNCTIDTSVLGPPTGGLAGSSRGTIANCRVSNTNITSQSSACGGIVGSSYGNIINCLSYNNTLSTSSANCGGISGISNMDKPTYIKNCYVYDLHFNKGTKGLFYGAVSSNKSTIEHSFYNTSGTSSLTGKGTPITTDDVIPIRDLEIPLHQELNNWINQNQSKYAFPLTQWKQGTTSTPAIFITE